MAFPPGNSLCGHFKLHWSSTVIFTASVVPANRCRLQSIFSFCALRHRKPSVAFSSLWSILLQWNTRWRKVIVHFTQSAHSCCTREPSFYLLCKCDISTPLLYLLWNKIHRANKKKSFTSLQRTRLQMKIPLFYKKLVITIFDATRTSFSFVDLLSGAIFSAARKSLTLWQSMTFSITWNLSGHFTHRYPSDSYPQTLEITLHWITAACFLENLIGLVSIDFEGFDFMATFHCNLFYWCLRYIVILINAPVHTLFWPALADPRLKRL